MTWVDDSATVVVHVPLDMNENVKWKLTWNGKQNIILLGWWQ